MDKSSVSSSPPLPVTAAHPPLSATKENVTPIGSKLAELNESRSELLGRIQGLKTDLQSWRSKLDSQVKVYRDELSELKKSLNTEVEQLRSEFQDLRTTLQQQQENVSASLRDLGDVSEVQNEAQATQDTKVDENGDAKPNVSTEDAGAKEAES